jgi:hypothetical protein
MTFYSQRAPKNIDSRVANAVRGTCPISMIRGDGPEIFDHESYLPNGLIISHTEIDHSQSVKNYLYMFMTKADWDRIEKFEEIGIENWNNELYEKEMAIM